VAEQQLVMTQLAHDSPTNTIPHAATLPPPPLPPDPPPLPLDPWPPPVDRHELLQLDMRQLLIPCAAERHDGLTVTFDTQACDCWAELLYWPFGQ
jgi:hypothetical protein